MSEKAAQRTPATGRLIVVAHPLIEDCLAHLRDVTTGVADFRRYARLLTQLLCFEATRDWPCAPATWRLR